MPLTPRRRLLAALGLGLAALAAAALAIFAFGAVRRIPVLRELWFRSQMLDSGGPLRPLQAAYDVRRIDLALRIDPERRRLEGRGTTTVVALESLAPLTTFEIQLDSRFRVTSAAVDGLPAQLAHERGLVTVMLARAWTPGERHAIELAWSGKPKVSPEPPWLDGFVWAKSASGAPWIAVTVQGDGADDWWPAKDHPSDEPDEGHSLELTIPSTPRGLVGLSNGHRAFERANADGTTTSRWESRHPINNYLLTVNVGPYVEIVERYRGADGTLDSPMTFYSLPEHVELARPWWREAPEILAVYARRFGEFPFLDDKIAVVDAPMSGMEHQTLVAYGEDFLADDSGIDETLVHELAHEWWGNKISVRDWDDFWIQEGFATYAEVLYVEETQSAAAARDYLERLRQDISNLEPLVAGRPRTSAEVYSNDLYDKGVWVLATLRWEIGDEAFFRVVRRFAGERPDECRLVDSAELARLVSDESGRELGWFWRRYLREAQIPTLTLERRPRLGGEDEIELRWSDPAFELAVPVEVDGELRRVETAGGKGSFVVAAGAKVELAFAGRVLAEAAPSPVP